MGKKDARLDTYIANAQPFARPILTAIRKAVHAGCPDVEETLKWRHPAYMYKGILAGMAAFKAHVTFGFWKASAMDGVSDKADNAAGQFGRLTTVDDLPDRKTLTGLVKQAAALHDQGVKAPRIKNAPKAPLEEPDYFTAALRKNRKALATYQGFSPSHRREYLEWVAEAKAEATRQRRLEAAIQWMAEGKARNWKYMALALASVVTIGAQPAVAQHEHAVPEKLGRVHFVTSCRKEVTASFDRAVALLHSFSFSAAKQEFEAVAAKDPACAMAHWGVAMTYWGNPFAGQRPASALNGGREAVARARAAGKPTPRERAYIDAVAALFTDVETVDQRTRVLGYERGMEQVYRKYPEDREGAAFYALAINQTALPADKTYAQQLKAVAILEKLSAAQPDHPGLAHYIIHAYDHPPLAPRALDAARRYSTIAPSAPHALHMPSHTFTRVGYWQDSIESNRASAAAATRDGVLGEALHAMDYLTYAYLQSGQDAAARRVVDEAPTVLARLDLKSMGGAAPPVAGQYAAAAIPARFVFEHGSWSDAAALRPTASGTAFVDAVTRFARALGAARTGGVEAARADLGELRTLGNTLAAAKDLYWAEQANIQQQIVSAWLAFAEGRKPEALAMMQKAADAEDATDKSAISPGPLIPARELLGEMLLQLERPAEALTAFEATITKEPNRFRATYFAAKAAALLGRRDDAARRYKQLLDICSHADSPGRAELQEARKFTGS